MDNGNVVYMRNRLRDITRITHGKPPMPELARLDVYRKLARQKTGFGKTREGFVEGSRGNVKKTTFIGGLGGGPATGINLFERTRTFEFELGAKKNAKVVKRTMRIATVAALAFVAFSVAYGEVPEGIGLGGKARQLGVSIVDTAEQTKERKAAIEAGKIEQVKAEMQRILDEDLAREAEGALREAEGALKPGVGSKLEALIRQLEAQEGMGEEPEGKGEGERKGGKAQAPPSHDDS